MDSIDRVIRNYLASYGVSPDYKGFQYLLLAIRLGIESPYKLGTIKNLFSEVGRIAGVPVSSVAARIRYALVNVDMDEDNEIKSKAFIIRAANQIADGMQGGKNPYAPKYRQKGSLRKSAKKKDGTFGAAGGEMDPGVFLDQAEDPVLFLDRNLNIRYMNQACLKRLGYSVEDLIGMPFSFVLPEEERQRTGQRLGECLEEGDFRSSAEHAVRTKGGGSALFKTSAFTVSMAGDEKYIILRMQAVPIPV